MTARQSRFFFSPVVKNLSLAAVYFLAAKMSLSIAMVHPSAAAIWPPTAIAFSALLLLDGLLWPGIFLGAFLANLTTAGSITTSMAIAGGNTLEAVAAAFLVERFAGGLYAFERPQNVFRFALFAGAIATLASATIGVTALCLAGYGEWTQYLSIWTTWWVADAAGNLLLTPVVILWAANPRLTWKRRQVIEAAAVAAVLSAHACIVFSDLMPTGARVYPSALLSLPVLVWTAFRFGSREAMTANLVFAGIAMFAMLERGGPFILQSPNESLLALQAFLGVIGIMVMALAAGVSQYRRSESEIHRLSKGLEARVLERTLELYERSALLADANKRLRTETAEREKAEEQSRRALLRVQALRSIEIAVVSSLDLRTILDVLLEKIEQFFPYPTAITARLLNGDTGELEPLACRNLDRAEWEKSGSPRFMAFSRSVIEQRAPKTLRDIRQDHRTRHSSFYLRNGLISAAKFPLTANGEVLGILAVYTKHEHEFTEEEIDFLSSLSGQAAVAIHHSQLYARVKSQTDELTLANKAKDQFLNVMSHELRTPLNVIMGYSSLLKVKTYGEITDKQANILDKVLLNANQQLVLINRILEVAQIAAGAKHIILEDLDLSAFLDRLQAVYESSEKLGVIVRWNYPSSLPVVETDGEKLKHIFQNLIENAIKFTVEGEIAVTASYDHSRGDLTFRIADTGIGISQEKIAHLFEMFFQADASDTRLHGGAGIGLYLVKNFTQHLGGTVDVVSQVGRGSTFTVTIPARRKRARLSA